MAVRIGIPRALGYYYMYPFYKTFLEELGAEVVVSPPTTKATLDRMEACPTDEPCVAVKLYFAHTEELLEMGVDYIWSPVLACLTKDSYCCPKFLGISDMVRNGLYIDSSKILMPKFDKRLSAEAAKKPFFDVAARIGIEDKDMIYRALSKAYNTQATVDGVIVSHGLPAPHVFDRLDDVEKMRTELGRVLLDSVSNPLPHIGVIGHPYLLYDMLSHNLIDRLGEFGKVVTAEMVSRADTNSAMSTIFEGHRMWHFEARMLGSALHMLSNHLVEKIVLVGSFECGPESIIESYVENEASRQGIPFLLLTIDEQTGEAGLITRIEAFMDTSTTRRPHISPPDPGIAGRKHGAMLNPKTLSDTEPASSLGQKACDFSEPDDSIPEILYRPSKGEMVVGFPSMGYLDIAIRSILEDCGTSCIVNPRTSKKALELGAELAPEFICYPLTATLGQMRILLDKGANTIFMVNGKGQCRLGWYGQVQENLLRRAGYEFEMIKLDSPLPVSTNWGQFSQTMKRLTNDASWPKIIQSIWYGHKKMLALDHAEETCRKIRAIERTRGSVDKVFSSFVRRMENVTDLATVKRESRDFEQAALSIETEDTHPLRVRVVGEIWVVLEHFANQEIEKMLAGQDRIRVEVDRELCASQWFRQNVLRDPSLLSRERKICRAGSEYLSEEVGGHGLETIGATVLARKEGCDGVIHIFPFTCMPEIIAQNILVRVSEDLDIPILTYIASEQTGEAGLQTRVEAFLDILEERRRVGVGR